jgi:cell division protein FtsB
VVRRKFDLAVLAACAALLGYFGWYAYSGPRGFDHMVELQRKVAQLEADRVKIAEERAVLDRRVGLMRPETTDPDMVDELARSELDFAHPADLVIMLPSSAPSP